MTGIATECEDSTQCVSACPVNWVEKDKQCYLWSRAPERLKSWDEAEQFCTSKAGGHLVSVTSKIVNDYLVKEMKKRDIYVIWLGGSDKEEEGVWKWLDCSSFKDHKFSGWARNRPSNMSFGKDQDCLQLWLYGWNDNACTWPASFVCIRRLCPRP